MRKSVIVICLLSSVIGCKTINHSKSFTNEAVTLNNAQEIRAFVASAVIKAAESWGTPDGKRRKYVSRFDMRPISSFRTMATIMRQSAEDVEVGVSADEQKKALDQRLTQFYAKGDRPNLVMNALKSDYEPFIDYIRKEIIETKSDGLHLAYLGAADGLDQLAELWRGASVGNPEQATADVATATEKEVTQLVLDEAKNWDKSAPGSGRRAWVKRFDVRPVTSSRAIASVYREGATALTNGMEEAKVQELVGLKLGEFFESGKSNLPGDRNFLEEDWEPFLNHVVERINATFKPRLNDQKIVLGILRGLAAGFDGIGDFWAGAVPRQ